MGKSPPPGEWVAVLDIGSNALRCVLARLDARPGVEVALRQRIQTRLGANGSELLPPDAIDATVRAARRFLKQVRKDFGPVRVLAVATAAVRDANNRDALLAPLAELDVPELRILSGAEEGLLGAEAALRAFPIEHGMVADLGGGSLQITAVEGGAIRQSDSAPLGVVRLMRRFIVSDPATPAELEALRAEIREQMKPLLRAVTPGGRALASGGTVNALASLALSRRRPSPGAEPKDETHGCSVDAAELSALRAWLQPMTVYERTTVPGLNAERADVIVIGAIVFEEVLALSGYPSLTASRTSVRDGVLWREALKIGR
jgi:exopolyphosphatase / guanosine-5'-triphosphate,3'-diphosphate pyrophosphatase